jgi:hypothetical protein
LTANQPLADPSAAGNPREMMSTEIRPNPTHPNCYDLFRGEHRVVEAETMTVCENIKGHLDSRGFYLHSECAEVAESILRGERWRRAAAGSEVRP